MWVQIVAAIIMIPVFAVALIVIIVAIGSVAETILRLLRKVWRGSGRRQT